MNLKSNDSWTVMYYEVKMYGLTRRLLGSQAEPSNDTELVLKNALVESSLLHTRIMVDIILSRGTMEDDVNLNHLINKEDISEELSIALDELRKSWGSSRMKNSPCWTLNKMLAHPTLWRSSSHDYGVLLNSVDPHIYRAIDELAKISGRCDLLGFL